MSNIHARVFNGRKQKQQQSRGGRSDLYFKHGTFESLEMTLKPAVEV